MRAPSCKTVFRSEQLQTLLVPEVCWDTLNNSNYGKKIIKIKNKKHCQLLTKPSPKLLKLKEAYAIKYTLSSHQKYYINEKS